MRKKCGIGLIKVRVILFVNETVLDLIQMNEIKDTGKSSKVVAKAGLWYIVCNFLFRGMAFITTPIFARLMTKTELGNFTNFSSWAAILMVITSFDLAQSIIRSKLEHENDIDSYIWSILSFSTLWTLLVYGIFLLVPTAFSDFLKIDVKYIHVMFLYLFSAPAYQMLITKHRAFYKYKMFVLLTGIMTISGVMLSLIMALLMQDSFAGRVLGYYIPQIVIGFAIFIFIVVKGKEIKIKYWKYACVICLPLVPHILSLYLLSLSDTIIITKLCGAGYTAVYSIAYSAYHIVTVLFDSMNKAWAPWLLESLHYKKYREIKAVSKIYIGVFVILTIGVLILTPEIIFVLGGNQYKAAVFCLPPLITSCAFQFIYTMYVNIEFYKKKTVGVCAATIVATIINVVLNLIFIPLIPEISYIIASYTTLVGYGVLFVLHYYIVKKMKMSHVYDIGYILKMLGIIFLISAIMNAIYKMNIIRYSLLILYVIITICLVLRYKNEIKGVFIDKPKVKS